MNIITGVSALPDRFAAKVEFDGECWLWLASKDRCGYGQIFWGGRPHKAHRVAYALLVGPVPQGLELDHLCRNRHCVRPSHMEAVTHRENLKRGLRGVMTTHCPAGHPYDTANTHIQVSGGRRCRACDRNRVNAANARRREVRNQAERS
jgi:hypothetical protein